MQPQPFTPKVLFDLYCDLPPEQRIDFLKRVARTCSAKEPLLMVEELSKAERRKFTNITTAVVVQSLLPVLVRHARALIRKNPRLADLTDEQVDQELDRSFREFGDDFAREVGALEREQLKEKRDRKSSPVTIRRNVEICDRRKQDKKKWTFGRLAKEYKIARQTVVRILNEEAKWRRRASQL